jgi:hypothetical protein
MSCLDHYKSTQPLVTSRFLPFHNQKSPGVIILPERGENFTYLQVEEGAPRNKHFFNYGNMYPSDYDSWNLRFTKLKAESAGPVPDKNQSFQDILSFAIRRDPNYQG